MSFALRTTVRTLMSCWPRPGWATITFTTDQVHITNLPREDIGLV